MSHRPLALFLSAVVAWLALALGLVLWIEREETRLRFAAARAQQCRAMGYSWRFNPCYPHGMACSPPSAPPVGPLCLPRTTSRPRVLRPGAGTL